ncbi:TPA: imidazole glycerol phosphate synthase subunit HisF [Legionella pneumophila]|uniref:imidazole glycerol phosphate synthase subunit HisF n=1 Tax=Legionella pneumophila TaxID=446 RepID=UPI000491A280|nr:imidazole glycerol phosphate synthase subunit HisF [Legionella pneumophila]RYB36326.1 imidazole glycerol phosphate synthase subunit HisF [Legionella pneumophila]RYW31249.1 imidazole glycerol phosphate synthase subunit HisF [Legionella pneumophila]HAT1822033.1 imidazole glycerol phosphate synthase subunit HisF [Legionella pneumophila]HAT1866151.1 imidazole glycerol phosphate synthase subunit HisF [Legionella pneumophila]HAT1906279.1 imidazole glycerol phosphate synthase subunit HisF [Legione
MLTKRIIPCLDVRDNQVVKGVKFRNHRIIGEILPLAAHYSASGADELVFYDITASSDDRSVCPDWVNKVAATINIPFTVAGGIRTLHQARLILNAGADKISINSPALENPSLINELSKEFGKQCVVVGVDSQWIVDDYFVYQYTGNENKSINSKRKTREWIREIQDRGAGEIVLNCMQSDGVRMGYDISQLSEMINLCQVPLIASGGAGKIDDFIEVFKKSHVSGALAASVFHDKILAISDIKLALRTENIEVRL